MVEADLPNFAQALGALLERVPAPQRPLLIALAERMAATRYRGWANEAVEQAQRSALLACADREEEIARLVESRYPDAASIQRDILAANPALEDITRSLFAGRSRQQQFTIQARGERLGAATWRSFADQTENEDLRQTFLSCAVLEEESAAYLESVLAEEAAKEDR